MTLASSLSAALGHNRAHRPVDRERRWRIVIIGLMLVADATFGASAEANLGQDDVLRLTESGHIRPFPQILDSARDYQPGKLLEAGLECERGRYVYEVELLDHDGKIWELKFDAKTGEFLSKDEDN